MNFTAFSYSIKAAEVQELVKYRLRRYEVMAVAIVKFCDYVQSEVKCAKTLAKQTSLRSNFTMRSITSRAARHT